MLEHGFLRVAACSPTLRVADPVYNAERTIDLLRQAEDKGVNLVVFPELGLTGYTCNDLFHDRTLQQAARIALETLLNAIVSCYSGVAVFGMPLVSQGQLFNCAVLCSAGRVIAIIPKTYLPNYKEFYDARYFTPGRYANDCEEYSICGQSIPFGLNSIFTLTDVDDCIIGVEICEDLWAPIPPSAHQAIAGATVLVNLSASNETIGKSQYRRQMVAQHSARCLAAYIYAGAGVCESSTDLVFGGHCLIAENGTILAESSRFRRDSHITIADIDLMRLSHDRIQMTSFRPDESLIARTRISFSLGAPSSRRPELIRDIDPHPFVPVDPVTRSERCQEIFDTQTSALASRLEYVMLPTVSIGVSGGLDSTLALIVLCKTLDLLGVDRSTIRALTMPGFGTTSRTLNNARVLCESLKVPLREIDIRAATLDQLRAIEHEPFGIALHDLTSDQFITRFRDLPAERQQDLVFENVQARLRTSLLMNTGFVLGTGDMSELALGWCTYNADHVSMYNPNVSIPKTLVRFLVDWAADAVFDGAARSTLHDIAATQISPELLPASLDGEPQSTEATVGPYELHDFFLYHMLRYGSPPEKILFLAGHAKFDRDYSGDEIRRWLTVFYQRFFASQFKRSCLPDGPKVGSVSLSPRGDWRMPSDATAAAWLRAVERG